MNNKIEYIENLTLGEAAHICVENPSCSECPIDNFCKKYFGISPISWEFETE